MSDKDTWWRYEAGVVDDLKNAGLSQRRALGLIGLSRGSWQLRTRGRPRTAEPAPHDQRRSPAWLSVAEVALLVTLLTTAFTLRKSVYQAFYEALDAGNPVASLSSWYRVARKHLEPSRPVRRRATRRSSAMPQWEATEPMQVWSWDITKLKGPYNWVWYDFYVVIDVFSRKIVGWRIEQSESAELAEEMFQAAIADHEGVVPRIVHSDRGPTMVSKTLKAFFSDIGVEQSKNRPQVSNDNPFSESWFKTAKYSPTAPSFFRDIEHSRQWAETFVPWYNREHRHSGLEGHTPNSVHEGTWVTIHQERQSAMDRLAAEHPERYLRPIQLKTPYTHVTLNTERPEDRLNSA